MSTPDLRAGKGWQLLKTCYMPAVIVLVALVVGAVAIAPPSSAASGRTVELTISARQSVTVTPTDIDLGSSQFAAALDVSTRRGFVVMRAPDGAPAPLVLPLATAATQEQFSISPSRPIRLLFFSDGPAKLRLPRGATLRRQLHRRPLRVRLQVATDSPSAGEAAIGTMLNGFGKDQISVLATVAYWPVAPAIGSRVGDACASETALAACGQDNAVDTFAVDTRWFYPTVSAGRYIVGRTYSSPLRGKYLTGDLVAAGSTPFTAAVLVAFGVGL